MKKEKLSSKKSKKNNRKLDYGLWLLMEQADRKNTVSESEIMNILNDIKTKK